MSGLNLRLVDGRPEPKRFWVDDALIDAKLRYYSKITYCVLARLVRGVAIKISHRDLARLGDLSVSSIQRGLAELETAGWIRKESGRLQEDENTYRLLGAPTQASQSDHSGEGGLVSQTTPRLVSQTTPGGEGASQPDYPGRSARPTTREEATTEETKKRKKQNPAPRNGAAKSAQAAQGLLLEGAGEAEVLEASQVPSPRPAVGPTHAVAGNGHDPAAAAPARPGHPAVALYCDLWTAHHNGTSPTITPKRVGILTRIYRKLGAAADVEYPKLLDALFSSADRFIIENAHSAEVLETKLDALRVNGHRLVAAGGREVYREDQWENVKEGEVRQL